MKPYRTTPGFVRTFFFGKDGTMPSSYTPDVRAKAVRLVREHGNEYDTE